MVLSPLSIVHRPENTLEWYWWKFSSEIIWNSFHHFATLVSKLLSLADPEHTQSIQFLTNPPRRQIVVRRLLTRSRSWETAYHDEMSIEESNERGSSMAAACRIESVHIQSVTEIDDKSSNRVIRTSW